MDTLDGLLTVDHAAGDLEGQIYRGLRDGILAGRLVAMGAHVAAMTPGELAEWVAQKVR